MNVNDLNRTDTQRVVITQPGVAPTNATQNISISAVQQENAPISINASNGAGVTEADNGNRPVIRINPNRNHKKHRTVGPNEEIETVNPDDYIQSTTKKVDPQFFQDKYMSQLDAAVTRKREEFADAVASMEAQDAANREKVEAGLEEVGGEIQYMPDPLHHPMTEDEKVKPDAPVNPKRGIVTEDLEDEVLDEDATEEEEEAPTHVRIQDGFNPVNDPFADEVHQAAPTYSSNPTPIVTEPVYEDDSEDEDEEPTPNEIVSEDIPDEADNWSSEKVEPEEVIEPTKVENLDTKVISVTSDDLEDIDDSDFDEEEDAATEEDDSVDDEEQQKLSEAAANNLRNDIITKIINAGRKMNASQLVVSNKVINIKDAMKNMKPATVKTAVWPLMFANRPYIASALKGAELAMLNEDNNSNGIMTVPQMQILFEHDVNPNRPSTVEAWAKTIPYADLDNIFAALFVASLDGANFMPCNCSNDKCLNSWLSEDIPIEKLMHFGDDETKKKFESIKKMDLTPENSGSYESVVTVINDNLAVGVKIPSLYTIMYEFGSLDDAFVNKYESIINVVRFIDRMYYIDEFGNMSPIGWKKYPGDHAKSFKSKIITYAKLLKTLDPVEFGVVSTLIITMMNNMHANITYSIPKYTCPKCGHSSNEVDVTPRSLLFLRQQLVRIATSLGGR